MGSHAKAQNLLCKDLEDEDEDDCDVSSNATVRRIALEDKAMYGDWRMREPRDVPNLRPVDLLAQDLARNTAALQELLTALQITSHQPPKPLLLPKQLNETRFKPRTSPLIQELSVYQVLGTAELVEQILVDVPAPTIIACRAVNKMFKNTIDGSKAIQQALFRIRISEIQSAQAPKINPFFENLAKVKAFPIPGTVRTKEKIVGRQLSTSKCKFTLFRTWTSRPCNGGNDYTVNMSVDDVERKPSWKCDQIDKEWCDMLLCQPPLKIRVRYGSLGGWPSYYTLTAETLGEAVDELMEKIELRQRAQRGWF